METKVLIETPKHLGGHMNVVHIDKGCLQYLQDTLDIKSMIDVGCGRGYMKTLADSMNILYIGIDGDPVCEATHVKLHDFSKGKLLFDNVYDLGWSVEFVEHVEEKFIENFISVFLKCRYVVMTHALPKKGGHHHVNCNTQEYWKNTLKSYGLVFDERLTEGVRAASNMRREFMRNTGMVFKNSTLV